MLFYYLYHIQDLCFGLLILSLLVTLCVVYGYSVNAQRSSIDPEKRNYHPGLVLLVFFTWPIVIPVLISLFLVRVLLYAIFTIVFTLLLILLPRDTPNPTRIEAKMAKLGEKLLEANLFLIRVMLRPWVSEPDVI
jgi:hypothetical protein